MTPEDIALAFAGTMAAGVGLFVLLCFAPEIRAHLRSRPPRENARKGDRKQEITDAT